MKLNVILARTDVSHIWK